MSRISKVLYFMLKTGSFILNILWPLAPAASMYAASMYRNAHRHKDHQQLLLRLCIVTRIAIRALKILFHARPQTSDPKFLN